MTTWSCTLSWPTAMCFSLESMVMQTLAFYYRGFLATHFSRLPAWKHGNNSSAAHFSSTQSPTWTTRGNDIMIVVGIIRWSFQHYNDVIMSAMASQSPASRLFTQSFIRAQIKGNIKAPRHWPLCGEFTGTGEFPAQRASNAENVSIWWRHHECGSPTACSVSVQGCHESTERWNTLLQYYRAK